MQEFDRQNSEQNDGQIPNHVTASNQTIDFPPTLTGRAAGGMPICQQGQFSTPNEIVPGDF